jgi:hypothetical protein
MTLDVVILVAAGSIAAIAGGLVLLVSPGRFVSFMAGAALALLGLVQLGFARAVYEYGAATGEAWLENALALGLAVSTVWVLLSATLGRARSMGDLRSWRLFLALQAAVTLIAFASVALDPIRAAAADPDSLVFPLRTTGRWIVGFTVLNFVLLAANFEAAHMALPRRYRRAFWPALVGVMVYAGFFVYVFAGTVFTGRLPVADLSLGAVPVVVLAMLLPLSLVRGRVGLARITRDRPRVGATASLIVACGFLLAAAGLLALTRAAGVSLAWGLWVMVVAGVALGVAALTVSNRLRRRLQRMVEPLLFVPRIARRSRAAREFDGVKRATTLDALARYIPESAQRVAGVEPVTLFLSRNGGREFHAVTSTLDALPELTVGDRDPLPVEMRRAGRPIRLHGRPDDLEYISIYVENGAQIGACRAVCAVPLFGEEDLVGFLLCGAGSRERGLRTQTLLLLHQAAGRYSERIERLWRQQGDRSRR